MKKEDFINIMQEIAPAHLADDFDNPGLLVDCESDKIRKVLLSCYDESSTFCFV